MARTEYSRVWMKVRRVPDWDEAGTNERPRTRELTVPFTKGNGDGVRLKTRLYERVGERPI